MYLKDLAQVIYLGEHANKYRKIIIKHYYTEKIYWEGEAINLKDVKNIEGWRVLEMIFDTNTCGYIISVN